jgi:hypothetical protein
LRFSEISICFVLLRAREIKSSERVLEFSERERERESFESKSRARAMAGSKTFDCPICLELAYKPVVEGCGHLFCFWCVHKSMNTKTVSHCPVCQKSYVHLPRICEQLHRLLGKIAPEEYARRASEVAEEEARQDQYSPQLEGSGSVSRRDVFSELQCKACNKLLYKPIVLNCGHLFCKTCVSQASKNCPSCRAHHPGPFPQPCIELHQYLEFNFPLDYAKRAKELKHRENELQSAPQLVNHSAGEDIILQNPIHSGVGCDGCGMMPILGKRFTCSDCPETVGYDLCASCHARGNSLPGRFNQSHGPHHRMVEKEKQRERPEMPWILLWSW